MSHLNLIAAKCDEEQLHVTLSDGRFVSVPLWWYPRLLKADPSVRNEIEILPMGLSWPKLDEDVSIDSIIAGEKAWGARDPKDEPINLKEFLASIRPLPSDWESREEYLIDGAYSRIDYRTLIHGLVERARDFCEPRPDIDYVQFFAATDTLLDVQNILHIAEHEIWPQSMSTGQLWMYGALQALAVQQDAAKQLLSCFKLTTHPSAAKVYTEVRDLRISAVGHPHNHNSKNLAYQGCTFLGQRERGSRTRFQVCTYPNNKRFVVRTIDVPELVARQQLAIQVDLSQAWKAVKDHPSYDPELNRPKSA